MYFFSDVWSPVDEKLLENLSMVDLFLNRPWRQKSVDRDVTILADPPGSLTTLHVGARVPVGIKDDDPGQKIIGKLKLLPKTL